MAHFVIVRHHATTWVTAFNNPDKLTNDLILKLFDDKHIISKTYYFGLDRKSHVCSMFITTHALTMHQPMHHPCTDP